MSKQSRLAPWLLALGAGVLATSACESTSNDAAADGPSTAEGGNMVAISTGDEHTCALTKAGGVLCWGGNNHGQLGDGSLENKMVPVSPTGLQSGVAAVSAGGESTCAVTTAGGVLCWGCNDRGQVGDGTTVDALVPTPVVDLSTGVAAVSVGGFHTCALTTTGGVLCWGRGADAELGNGSTTPSLVPIAVTGLSSGVASISAGAAFNCAVTTAGGALCWGFNHSGQLGSGRTAERGYEPMEVAGLSSRTAAVSAGGSQACALVGGGAQCWGYNGYGELGNGSKIVSSNVPVAVTGLSSGVAAISAGFHHSCAVTGAGSAHCWGDNSDGEIGDGSTTNAQAPVAVAGLPPGTRMIAAGGSHTCALSKTGAVHCWGMNSYGQLGDGSNASSPVPVRVAP
jgi:alpha-tubulin suppressor-like RCC1 family protein